MGIVSAQAIFLISKHEDLAVYPWYTSLFSPVFQPAGLLISWRLRRNFSQMCTLLVKTRAQNMEGIQPAIKEEKHDSIILPFSRGRHGKRRVNRLKTRGNSTDSLLGMVSSQIMF